MASIILELQIDDNIDDCDCYKCEEYFQTVKEMAQELGIGINLNPLEKRFITMLRFMLEGKLLSLLDEVCNRINKKDYTPLQLNPLPSHYINITFSGMPESQDNVSNSDRIRPGQRRFA